MIASLRRVAQSGDDESANWARMRIHRIARDVVVNLGYSSKLNAEWDFLILLRDEGRRATDICLIIHRDDLAKRSSFDLDALLEGV